MADNKLYYGDNLDVLRRYVADESVDLVYLDPPFKSQRDYNVLFREQSGQRSEAQIKAFEDTWRWDTAAARAFEEVVEAGGDTSRALQALRTFLGETDMLAYLSMMAPRLSELWRVMKDAASIYLHCDPAASHYLKMLMDAVFGPHQFRNEVIWKRTTAHSSAKRYAPIHDVILYYSKGDAPTWNEPRTDYKQEYLDKYYRFDDGDGRLYWRADITGAGVRRGATGLPWRGLDVTAKGRHWAYPPDVLDQMDSAGHIYWPSGGTGWPQEKRYREDLKGKAVSDIWTDIDRINPVGSERLGYPTQKPEALLERIVDASSNPGGVVLDPFCGCGTAVAVAEALDRRWIGIDVTHLAINLIKHRLFDAHGDVEYDVIGEPVSVSGAQELALADRFQFESWALGLVKARKTNPKKGADKGIDGRLYFHDSPEGPTRQIVISVKSGKPKVSELRDLRGVVDREGADIGVLITLQDPTGPMRREAASSGFYDSSWGKHPSLQILTVQELFDGARIDYPPVTGANVTYQRAPRHVQRVAEQLDLEADS